MNSVPTDKINKLTSSGSHLHGPTRHIIVSENSSQEDVTFTLFYPKGTPIRKIYHIQEVPAIDLR